MPRIDFYAAIGSVLLLAACATSAPEPGSVAAMAMAPQAASASESQVIYVTDRAPIETSDKAFSYGSLRSKYVSFGEARLAYGASPTVGPVVEEGQFPPTPYGIERVKGGVRRDPAVVHDHDQAAAALRAEIGHQLAKTKRKEVIVFVHGYANKFDDAIRSTGDICRALDNQFVCIAMTWPAGGSGGTFMGYNVDRESGEFAVNDFKRMIRIISTTPGLERLHIIAHSRGTDVTASVMQQLGIEAYVARSSVSQRFKINNIILFAPDIDLDVATSKMFAVGSDPDLAFGNKPNPTGLLPQGNIHLTVYSSPHDRALGLSSRLFGSVARLGQLSISNATLDKRINAPTAAQFAGLADFIEFDGRAGFVGHSYFLTNPTVAKDLNALLLERLLAGDPRRPLKELRAPFWKLVEPGTVTASAAKPAM